MTNSFQADGLPAPQDEPPVELMDDGTSPDAWALHTLYDQARDEYLIPEPPGAFKNFMETLYLRDPGATAEKFAAAWPRVWELTETVYRPEDSLLAIIDSGVLQQHPLLKDCIRDTVDFTGEGVEDRVGHGTLTTLLARMIMTGVPRAKFVIIKCVGQDGRGVQDNLIAALRWMQAYNRTHEAKIGNASLSLGVYNKIHFGLSDCNGTCRLCRTAVEVSQEITLSVAAGNLAGKTACPARAAFLPSKPDIRAVARPEESTSGIGTVGLNVGAPGTVRFLKLGRA